MNAGKSDTLDWSPSLKPKYKRIQMLIPMNKIKLWNGLELGTVKEGRLMCFRHSFLRTIWCLSVITFRQDLGEGVTSATQRSGHIQNMVQKHHEELRESLVELWYLLWSILVISLVCFFLVKLILPFFSMLLTCFGNKLTSFMECAILLTSMVFCRLTMY